MRFLSDAEVDHLADRLAQLPEIERELAIALTGQTHAVDAAVARSQPRSRPPYPIHLQVLADQLKAALVAAVRDVSETRGHVYDGADTITGCGVWLSRHRSALRTMDSGVETFEQLCGLIDQCAHHLGWHRTPPLAPAERDAARVAIVTASTVEAIARRVGAGGLTSQRLRSLARRGHIRQVGKAADGTALYRLGEVLDAHRDTPRAG